MIHDPMYTGRAISPANTDLDLLAQYASNAQARADSAFASAAAALATIRGTMLWIGDFAPAGWTWGVDDTTVVQAALTAGATQFRVVYGGGLACTITSALTMAGPGLVFDTVEYGDPTAPPDPGLKVSGTGYTALTVTGIVTQFAVTVYGTGNAANGILFQNPQRGVIQHARVHDLDGFGIKINKCYDCVWGALSVESCGNATHYAFSLNDDGDTCNMSTFTHIQVEQANRKAVYISAATLGCVFVGIHSERATPNAADITWYIGGNSCVFDSLRLNSLAPEANATAHFHGTETLFNAPIVEGAVVTRLEGIGGYSLTFASPNFQGTTGVEPSQIGTITILGGAIITFSTDTLALRVFGTKITTLTVGYANSDVTWGRFENCNIGTLASSSAVSAATFVNCIIAASATLLGGGIVLIGSDVTLSATVTQSTGSIVARDSIIRGAVTYNNNVRIRLYGSQITGALTCGDAGLADVVADDGSTVGAGSSSVGVPTAGAHVAGEAHKNLTPAVGQPTGWVCTVAGTPGTWAPNVRLLPAGTVTGTTIGPAALQSLIARLTTDALILNGTSAVVPNVAGATVTSALTTLASTLVGLGYITTGFTFAVPALTYSRATETAIDTQFRACLVALGVPDSTVP